MIIRVLHHTYAYDMESRYVLMTRINIMNDINDWYQHCFHSIITGALKDSVGNILSWNIFLAAGRNNTDIPVIRDWNASNATIPFNMILPIYKE